MRKSRLFILVNGTWKEVDLFNDISIPLNYSVSDIQDISKRNTSYSLNIDLPNTKNNAEVFNYIFKIEQLPVSGSFEMLQKYEAVLEVDNTTVFDGYFKLEKVIIDDLKSVTYKGILYDNVKNFVEILGNQTLRGNTVSTKDLDFSTYKTTAANMTLGYMRDKLNTFPSSGGYGLTLIDKTNKAAENFSSNYQNWYSDELTPYLTVKEIWDKIFQQAGYAYESDFLDGGTVPSGYPDFTKLIYPYPNNNNKLGDTGNYQKITSGGSFDWITTYFNMNVPYDIMFGNSGNYIDFPSSYTLTDKNMSGTVTHWQFVAPYTSSYHIKFKIPIALKFDLHSYDWDSGTWNPRYTGNISFGDTTKEFWLHGQLSKIHSGNTTRLAVWGDFKNFESSYTTGSDGKMLVDTLELKYEGDVRLQAGDVVALTTNFQAEVAYYDSTWDRWFSYLLHHGTGGGWVSVFPYPATVELTQPAGIDVMEITQNQYFGEGQEFDPTYILNPKTKKWDFINSIVKMFNLYIEDIGDKKFRIEPRDLYYATDVKRDFTDRVDTDSINFTRVDTYIYSDVNFKFKQDKDAETEAYNGTYLIPYGEFVFAGALSNGSDSVDISPIFGSTMCGIVNAQTSVLQCPKMYAFKSNSDVVNVDKEYSDRIFYAWQNNMYSHASTNYGVRIKSRYTSSTQTQTSYYCADILDAGYGSDTQVLSWGDNEVYLENTLDSTVSSSNLYNRFYRQMLAEFNDTEARILTCKMFLTADDIRNLRLSDTIYVNGIDYRINSIKQWEGYDKPTEVQLVKIVRPTTADLPIRIDSFLNTLDLESNAQLNTMKGATADDDGASGWVPIPEAGDEEKFLRGDGTWQTVESGNTYTGVAPIDITNTQISLNVGGGLEVGDHDELTVKLDTTTMTLNANGEITAYIPDIRVKHINYIDEVFDSKDFNWLDIDGMRDMTIVVNDYTTEDNLNTYRYFRLDTSNPEEENLYIFESDSEYLTYRNNNTWSIARKPLDVQRIRVGNDYVSPNDGIITLAAGSNVTLTSSGSTITIAANAGVTKLQSNGIDVEPTNGAVNLVSGNNMLFLTSGNSITIDAPAVSDFVDTQDDAYIIYYLAAGTPPLSNSWITAYTYTSVNTYNQTTGVGRFYLKPNAVLGGADTPFSGNTNLLEVNLTYSHLTTIGMRAFFGCSSLTKVTFGTQVLTIGRQCFQNCTSLTTLAGWSGIQTIGSGAFYNCGFTSLDFNADSNVETIGQGAFSSCMSLTTVNLTTRTTFYGTDVFQNCTALTSVTLRGYMQKIPMYMFNGCTGLTSIHIPLGVTEIGYRAFYGCTNLTDISLSKTIASIDSEAFGRIGADYTVTCDAVTMPFVGDDAFSVHS